jgi:hypothetical protein
MDFYELRHFCATHLLELGVSHADVAVQLGHTDGGALGGFKWSSQHLVMEVVGDGCWEASAGGSRDAWSDVVAGPALDCAA